MDTLLTISEAARIVHLSEKDLYELIKNGTIKSAMHSGTIFVTKEEVTAFTPLQKREGYHNALASVEIGIVEASEKYNIPHPTISRWVKSGLIQILRQDGRKKLISEGDIEYLATRYHQQGGGQGRWIFDARGNLYVKKQK
jgi:excisionase family DNA binding protein